MKIRRIIYCCMSMNYLTKRQNKVSTKLDVETDSKKRMKFINDEFDMLHAVLFKGRKDKKFIQYVKTSTQDFIDKRGREILMNEEL